MLTTAFHWRIPRLIAGPRPRSGGRGNIWACHEKTAAKSSFPFNPSHSTHLIVFASSGVCGPSFFGKDGLSVDAGNLLVSGMVKFLDNGSVPLGFDPIEAFSRPVPTTRIAPVTFLDASVEHRSFTNCFIWFLNCGYKNCDSSVHIHDKWHLNVIIEHFFEASKIFLAWCHSPARLVHP